MGYDSYKTLAIRLKSCHGTWAKRLGSWDYGLKTGVIQLGTEDQNQSWDFGQKNEVVRKWLEDCWGHKTWY